MSEWFDSDNNIIVDTLPELMSAANTRQFGETKAETLTRFLMCEAFERRYVPEEALAFRLAAMIISRIETQPAAPAQPRDDAVFVVWWSDHMPNSIEADAWAEWCALRSNQPAAQALDAREKQHLDVACAIWEVMREYEDRCDMELEDVGCSHVVWQLASAAIAAQQGDTV